MSNVALVIAIKQALLSLEERGDIVACSTTPDGLANAIAEAVEEVIPNTALTTSEMLGLRALIFHAINDDRFFDWEMPTLTGLSAEEFRVVAEKLPKG